jgi:hypothetical protein
MSWRFRSAALAAGLGVVAASGVARAEPGLRTATPNIENEAPPGPRAGVTSEAKATTHVFDAFRVHADGAASQRLAGSVSSLVVGATFVGVGLVARERWNEDFGTFLTIFGGVAAAGGLLTLVLPTEAEKVADENGVYRTPNPTPEQEATLENAWARLARKAKTGRHVGAAIGFVLSGAALVSGIVVAASDGIDDDTKDWLAPTLFASGGVFAAGSVASLVMETPVESSYAAFRATQGRTAPAGFVSPAVRVSAMPLPKGGFVGFAANF